MVVNPSASGFGREFYQYGYKANEAEFERVFRMACFDGMTFVDVGANWGYFVLSAADVSDPERMIAFEPHPENAYILRQNLELNSVEATVEELAVSDVTGEEVPWQHNKDLESARIAPRNGNTTVGTVRLDEYLVKSDLKPDLIKVDVEGAEKLVMDGLSGKLGDVSALAIELHATNLQDYGHNVKGVLDPLLTAGFELVHLDNAGTVDRLKSVPTDIEKQFSMSSNTVHVVFGIRPGTSVHSRLSPEHIKAVVAGSD